ncbi:ureidoglycolate lyase [Dongia rigui]|uniref:Ureidoglycolate lyase n=1 Tax=Dongia rigui TaxID=940149 RepID=A0ABU5DTE8_9PROT|nr:ureidoglycolate lyase [Dongia rigui]MDY0870623.1 ureidoglycolate lyase [Dongia rigui]
MKLKIEQLDRGAFAPFGDVIACDGSRHYQINDGFAERYHDLAKVDIAADGGRPLINIFRAKPRTLPLQIAMMERHPLSSQAFMPLMPRAFLVVVAAAGTVPTAEDLRCFRTHGLQGVNYAPGTWHFPLIALETEQDFLVVDRGGPGRNCDEVAIAGDVFVVD